MSCFIVPMVQAIATSVYRRRIGKVSAESSVIKSEIPSLEKMLWGATLVLVVDHIAAGEISWQFPFFTALGKTGGFEQMLDEMLTVGVPMSLALTAVWLVLILFKLPAFRRQSR